MEKIEVLPLLATSLGRRDEVPNQELAAKIAAVKDADAVKQLVGYLEHKDKGIRHDALKALYELGYINPAMIAPYADTFVGLLKSKVNRMVWGAMIALSEIVKQAPEAIFPHLNVILETAEKGSVITRDGAFKILVGLYGQPKHADAIFELLNEQLLASPVNQLPMYAELLLPAVLDKHRPKISSTLESRLDDVEKESKRKRINKVLKKLG